MSELVIRKAEPDDREFAWTTYAENAKSFMSLQGADGVEKSKFVEQWDPKNTRIITLDGERIGWYSCVIRGSELVIENLQVVKGNRGIPSFVLNVVVMEATGSSERLASCSFKKDPSEAFKKVSLQSFKNDPSLEFFRKEAFPIAKESDVHM